MIYFVPTDASDVPLLQKWIQADPWHSVKDDPEWWISPGCYLNFRLNDDLGVILFVRLDRVGETSIRLNTQFAPVTDVSEQRTAKAIIQGITTFIPHGQTNGVTELVTESSSPKLIVFLEKLGFKSIGGNDYKLDFKDGIVEKR